MRRLAPFALVGLALGLPAGALAIADAPGDGTLVVKNGSAPRGVPVVTLVIQGTAIGHVSTASDQVDKVVIDDVNNSGDLGASNTTGAIIPVARKTVSDTETRFVGSDFRFRAAGGLYKVWIYGSGVDVFAVGTGKVTLQGLPDSSIDGRYSFNGGDFRSLPAAPTDWLTIGSPAGSNG